MVTLKDFLWVPFQFKTSFIKKEEPVIEFREKVVCILIGFLISSPVGSLIFMLGDFVIFRLRCVIFLQTSYVKC